MLELEYESKVIKILVINKICSWLPPGLDGRFLGGFGGIWPPRWDTISTNLTKVRSTGHSGSSGILLMLTSIVVPEKLPGQKRWRRRSTRRRRRRRIWIFGRFWHLFTITPTWLFATFWCLCVHSVEESTLILMFSFSYCFITIIKY